ncbi:kinase domain protein [Mycobacterium parascrofulaceum ATCC BAA-614]|uniref:non-specific serine/threonine protein kinase n=2 Tax=Mycobacterium parascrofulaceum TaxID=240125 RepID=D5PCS6_9MYCO|nr:kinase domain protein [Mycobacterium parascrofulaceum ATCC BAA-614]
MDEVGGEVFGRYRLFEVLRSGGTGIVYRAYDTMMGRGVAIKVLPPELAAEPGRRERFLREVSAAAQLSDPNLIPIYEAGEIDGRHYLVMPAVPDGSTVQDLLRREGPTNPAVAVRVIVQAASALEAAHVAGLVHGDVNTSNLLVGGPFVYLIDFGATPTATDTADARTDIYALTAVLYECLTGQTAVVGDLGPPKPTDIDPAIPPGFDNVIARGMAKDPDDRYQTARELAAATHNALTAESPAASGAAPTKAVEFGRYRLFEKLGQGNMGAVYRAHDTALGRDVAIKLLQPELAAEPGYQERFRREAYAAARLASPNIIPVYEIGEYDGRLYLVMPIVDGVDLNKVLKTDGAMSPQQAVRVVEQVAAALDAAHKSGLVHRDVKPSNLLMVGEGFVYLIDFGLVHEADATRLTLTNVAPGSPAYMAPERFGGGKVVDARADVYSLACVLYECLTGRVPFSGGGVEGLTAAHRNDAPPKPSGFDPAIPVGFDAVIARGMAKEPDDRYQSAHELAVAARAALADDFVAHAAPSPSANDAALSAKGGRPENPSPPRTPRQRLGRAGVLTLATVVVVAVVGGVALLRVTRGSPFHSAKPKGQVVLPFTGLDNPQRVAVDSKGDVYVTDTGNNRVLRLAAGSTSQTVIPIAGLDRPLDIAVDDAGDLDVTEPAQHRVLELAAGSTDPTVLPFTDLGDPTGVAVDFGDSGHDRVVVVTDCARNRVVALRGRSTQQKELPFSGLSCPSAVTVGGAGDFFVIDRENERVLRLPLRGTVPTVLPFLVGHPDNVAVDTSGNVYVTDVHDNRVTEFAAASNTSEAMPFKGINNPQGISVDSAGNVYVVDTGNNRVLKLPAGVPSTR